MIPDSISITLINHAAFEATGEGLPRAIILMLTEDQKAELSKLIWKGETISGMYPIFQHPTNQPK